MRESERNRLQKRVRALVLAARDLEQAAFAAERLDNEMDGRVRRLLETAMAITYMRPFTTSSLLTLTEYVPTGGHDRELHEYLAELRAKVYAHTDKEAERRATLPTIGENQGVMVFS